MVFVMSKNKGMMGDFQPLMPSLIRLLAGVLVLVVVQAVILGFPGIVGQTIPGSTIGTAALLGFCFGLVAAVVVLKFGTQLSIAAGEAWRSIKAYVPLLTYFFQIAALWILYVVSKDVASGFFTSAPWAYPLIFLALAIIPTIKVVVAMVRALEGTQKRTVAREQF